MAGISANGITIEYERYGRETDPTVLLIMGLGAQLTRWPMQLVNALVGRGYQVIRYDNRDVGLSQKFDAAGIPNMGEIAATLMRGEKPVTPYTLDDMAADAAGLLDALGIEKAHIMGASMGGMIAQVFAADFPEKTLSLTSIMSSSGNPALPPARPEAMAVLTSRPQGADLDSLVAHGVNSAKVIGSPGYPVDEAVLAERVREDALRSIYPAGFARQMAAIYANGDRRQRLAKIAARTVVIHGTDDPLVPVEGGRDTAASIPGARLVEIPGMGHDLPEALIPQIVEAFEGVAQQREAA